MSKSKFAAALKRARKRAGLSQVALGKKAGLTGSYISMLESERKPPPRPKVIARLSKVLGLSEKHMQELAAVERSPAPIRQRLEEMDQEKGAVARTRDRILTTTLFHIAQRHGHGNPFSDFLDLSPGQRTLAGRLLGRARSVRDVGEAESKSSQLLEDASQNEREMLAKVLPEVLSQSAPGKEKSKAGRSRRKPETDGNPPLPVYADLTCSGQPIDWLVVDPQLWHERAFLWRVSGDDYFPRIEAGDDLLVDPLAEPKSGDLVAFTHAKHDLVRTLQRSSAQVRLDAPRPDVPPIRMKANEFRPAGVVVWMCRALP